MEPWETALHSFLDRWRPLPEVRGALVCGSFVTGFATNHSDIDLHIVLSDDVDWRERGNAVVDGFLVEYFANPAYRIPAYMEEDYADNTTMAATQFATGRIIFDDDGSVERLKELGLQWIEKPFPEMGADAVRLAKYMIWDSLDNLHNAHDQQAPDLAHVYHHTLRTTYAAYAKYLRQPVMTVAGLRMYLSDPQQAMARYMVKPFPDERFAAMLMDAVTETRTGRMQEHAHALTHCVLDAMGGFTLDGWRFRSPARTEVTSDP